jgi:uncharacterized membrane protein YraQ (UPF0718 family)
MELTVTQLVLGIAIAVILGGSLAYLFWKQRKEAKQLLDQQQQQQQQQQQPAQRIPHSVPMQLQAYERLILLAERISLPSLINRLNQPGLSVKEMQSVLTQNIRQEFDYNITQQIYVSNEAWEAVRNLKDQNLLIINQVASFMPSEATGVDLNKSILEMLMQSPKASLHGVVSEVLSYEAKKLMK